MNNKYIWQAKNEDWVQDNENKRFFLYDRKRQEINRNQSGLEVSAGAKWHPHGRGDCSGYFPLEFEDCPFCGQQLGYLENTDEVWVPPVGNKNGLRLLTKNIDLSSLPVEKNGNEQYLNQETDSVPLPHACGNYHFLVSTFGTKSTVLVAFDRTTGSVDYYSPVEKKWISFEISGGERVSESRLPEWAWSSTFMSDMAGFVVPTDDGPVWIALDWGNCSYSAISGIGKCIGGVALLQNHVMVPSRLEDAIIINTFDHTALKWLQVCTIAETDISESRADTFFSIPVVDERRQEIYWIGFRGRLIYSKAQGSCTWQPWETDQYPCRAIPELGPPYRDKLGEFWQLCYDKDENSGIETVESYRYYKLKGDESDREDVLLSMFCSGISCFSRNYAHWESPWDAVDEKLHRENLASVLFRVPLLCLNHESKATVAASFGKGLFLPPFLLINDPKTTHVTNLLIEIPHERPIQLKTNNTLTLSAPWELRLFIYQNVLFAYHARTQAFCSWRMK